MFELFSLWAFPRSVQYMLGLRTGVILQRGTMTLWVLDRAGSPGEHLGDGVIFSGSGSLADLVE